jgi:hypothetical protein
MFEVSTSGSFSGLESFLKKASSGSIFDSLSGYGREGVSALAAATPVDGGQTKEAWDYEIKKSRGSYQIIWTNNEKTVDGEPIAIMLQLGHGTGTGGYVRGRDYINPAMRPIFDAIADKAWKAVTSA